IESMKSVINMDILPPAALYPFITGLKFIPLLVLIGGFWVGCAFSQDRGFEDQPALGLVYNGLGCLFLAALFLAGLATDDYNLLSTRLPGWWLVSGGYLAALGANVALWRWGYSHFKQPV